MSPTALHAAEETSVSPPVGALGRDVPVGLSGLTCPLSAGELLSGMVQSNSGAVVTLAETGARPGALLTVGGRYYVEVTSGPLEGERFDLNTAGTISSGNATLTLDLSGSSFSTLAAVPAGALAEARVVLRSHLTLGRLGAMFSPALVGNNNYNLADSIRVCGPNGFVVYYLRGDGQTWRTVGGTADLRQLVIPPDAGVLASLRSGLKQWRQSGAVRTNVFRKNLTPGTTSFASGFPLPLSFTGIGGLIDSTAPATERWVGDDNPAAADQMQIFNPATGGYDVYYLRADGTSWRKVGGGANVAGDPLIGSTALVFVLRHNADNGYLILRPFAL